MRRGDRRILPSFLLVATACLFVTADVRLSRAHGSEARYVVELEWTRDNIARTFGVSRSELGIGGRKTPFEIRTIGNRSCVVGPLIALDVDDGFAFDIDEPVDLTVTYAPELTAPFRVGWNRNGGDGIGRSEPIEPEPGATFRQVTLTLDRARFAGQGTKGTDLAIGGRGGMALCDVELARSGTTVVPASFGRLRLAVQDAGSGRPVPARIGLYDATGRAPLPSERSILVHRFTDEVRLLWVNQRTFWPSENRLAFYVDGDYEARLPAGTYELVATRGPEYRAYREEVEVRGGETRTITVALERYDDLPGRGWFSGDSHVHIARDETDDDAVWGQIAAEDIHVANLLEMGNIAVTHFKQPAWGEAGGGTFATTTCSFRGRKTPEPSSAVTPSTTISKSPSTSTPILTSCTTRSSRNRAAAGESRVMRTSASYSTASAVSLWTSPSGSSISSRCSRADACSATSGTAF